MKKLLVGALAAGLFVGGAGFAQAKGPDPSGPSKYGLCKAYFAGSENGQANKRKAPPFQNLEAAAEAADQTVEEYCASATPGGK
jgi:hypothetical protein